MFIYDLYMVNIFRRILIFHLRDQLQLDILWSKYLEEYQYFISEINHGYIFYGQHIL